MKLSPETRQWLEGTLDIKVVNSEPLLGGTSSRLWLITIREENARFIKVVLREYTDKEWLALEPGIAEQEALNLKTAQKSPVTAPILLAADPYAKVTTHPTVVMSHIEGKVMLQPENMAEWLDELAKTLAALHNNKAHVKHSYFRYFDLEKTVRAAWSSQPQLWRKAFSHVKNTPQPESEKIFIHRDFHPTNVLFKGTTVNGVIDWPNACMGPREVDVAHCRWNLAMLEGVDAADAFLIQYLKHSGIKKYDHYWDLEALLNVFSEESPVVYAGWEIFGRTDVTPQTIRDRMDAFLVQALMPGADR
ncbi:Ser/Thr protein kinase RdoA involved in Cpx stress response, MazF antagonist [Alkalibacterium subtropicum]|uniref:Ser/Thr protein kinase RdoA involved in Cpx stress response, MazF antagonist n=1 Tax=Alkalibacterium subtropicum TaxID=753702 RepID=A0A1I1GQZ9_9LACT|nr:aminoglycoside phosphotransferase family protein [Alkalibacterium subtropicum]SFC11673.1 Ser/Thr protein kinase RdoA involved in Cpx stress response, MazF antagonist [Alkalibacterium subtropicum]